MNMMDYIIQFPEQIKAGLKIAEGTPLKSCDRKIENLVICGLGGSGIGGKIVSDICRYDINIPVTICNDYRLPNCISNNTLVIVSSYSGNTEETLTAMNSAIEIGAELACITSGGKVLELAKKHNFNAIVVPGGHPPRACLAYSIVQQFKYLKHYGLTSKDYLLELAQSADLIDNNLELIKSQAKEISEHLFQGTGVLYAESSYEGVVIRMRQQLNENSKYLCWHHVLPEMNHNELVGWGGGKPEHKVVMLRAEDEHPRTSVRMELCKEIIDKKSSTCIVQAKGDTKLQRSIYLILIGDWTSWYLSELNGVDAIEIDVINFLKGELAKV